MVQAEFVNFLWRLWRKAGLGRATTGAKKQPRLRMATGFDNGRSSSVSPVPAAPGYQLTSYSPGREAEWIGLFNASEEFGVWDPQKLQQKLLCGLISGGGVLAAAGNELVATASACQWPRFLPMAVLEYVVVHPRFRGQGLGRLTVAEAMRCASAAGYPGMVLETDDFRLPAIRVYLKLGFKPDTHALPETEERWSRVLAQLPSRT